MSARSRCNHGSCGCCHGIWRPEWGRDRILPGDTGRSWYLTNPMHFGLLRITLAIIGSIFLLVSMVTDKPPPRPEGNTNFAFGWFSYWKFYSHWTLALCTLYCVFASMLSYALWKKEKNPLRRDSAQRFNWEMEVQVARPHVEESREEGHERRVSLDERRLSLESPRSRHGHGHHRHHRRISFSELCLWFFYQTVWAAAIFCAFTYWFFIGLGCLSRNGCKEVSSKFWIAQVLNLLFVVTEIVLNKLPFLPFHSILSLAYCVLWLIFSAILFFVTGQWVYPQNPTHSQLYSAFTFWPGWILLNVVSFFVGFGVEWALSRCITTKHSLQNPHEEVPLPPQPLNLQTHEEQEPNPQT